MEDKELKEKLLKTKELVKGHIDKTDRFLLVTEERVVSVGTTVDRVSLLASLIANFKDNKVPVSVIRHAVELGLADDAQKYIKDTMGSLIEKEKERIKEMEEFLK